MLYEKCMEALSYRRIFWIPSIGPLSDRERPIVERSIMQEGEIMQSVRRPTA